jgi:hypothetical protein
MQPMKPTIWSRFSRAPCREVLHLVDGLLLGEIAHAARVQQHHVRDASDLASE